MPSSLSMDMYSYICNTLFSQVQSNYIYAVVSVLLVTIWIVLRKPPNLAKSKITDLSENLDIEENMIKLWTPKPLISLPIELKSPTEKYVIESKVEKYVTISGQPCINFATHNYFNFQNDKDIENIVVDSVNTYGIGSCGPRAFYGTFDTHIELEEKLASFMEMEEAIIYSYGFSTVASAIPAYIKVNDIVYVDEEVNFAIQKGLQASKAEIVYFKHNCPEDLEHVILNKEKNVLKGKRTRKAFLIVEGIYNKTGNICNLPKLIDIRIKYKIRIFIDETISFGVLGKKGRGVTEHFNIPIDEVDLIIGSLETSLSSVGGFCVGTTFVVDHQRLTSLGYGFSASLPPLLSVAAIKALDRIDKHPEMLEALKDRCLSLHLRICDSKLSKFFTLGSDKASPLKHLYLMDKFVLLSVQQNILNNIVNYCISNGIAITTATYLNDHEHKVPRPSIRLLASICITDDKIDLLIKILWEASYLFITETQSDITNVCFNQ